MELSLANNIKTYRKQRSLTQERLAEVLGVTTGAVYKWESGLSVPDLSLIVEMADFFDVSVDALLGYRMKDNREEAVVERLTEYCLARSPDALPEAEKALKKYPNSFEIVHNCAALYMIYGVEFRDNAALRRALELLEQARRLISQNKDPETSELTLYGEIASVYTFLGEQEKGLDILKKYNACGLFNDSIGTAMAVFLGRPKEAEPYLQKALMSNATRLINSIVGYVFIFLARGDCKSAQEILTWGISFWQGMKTETGAPDVLDKTSAELYILLAHTQLKTGQTEEADASVKLAADYAARFDAEPNYGVSSFRYVALPEKFILYDSLGATAAESVERFSRLFNDQELASRWKEAAGNDR